MSGRALKAAVVLILLGSCRGPQVGAIDVHRSLAPDTPDQVCLVCHGTRNDEAPSSPHRDGRDRYRRCPRCHGPHERPADGTYFRDFRP